MSFSCLTHGPVSKAGGHIAAVVVIPKASALISENIYYHVDIVYVHVSPTISSMIHRGAPLTDARDRDRITAVVPSTSS